MSRVIKVAVALIFNESGQVLLTQRSDPRNLLTHNKWQFPGGGVEKNETPESACIREIEEETGLVIELLTNTPLKITHKGTGDKNTYDLFGYPARWVSGTINTENDDETADAKWMTLENIDFTQCIKSTKLLIETYQTVWKKN